MTPRSPRGKKIIIQVDESSEKYRPKKYIKDDGKLPLESILNLPNGKWMDSILRLGKRCSHRCGNTESYHSANRSEVVILITFKVVYGATSVALVQGVRIMSATV